MILLYLIPYNKLFIKDMGKLTEELGRILNLLEDAVEEQDWKLVQKMIDDLDNVYESLEKQESGFDYDYD